jgi:phosphatidylinositol alpha-1,6-mannosyltransferase
MTPGVDVGKVICEAAITPALASQLAGKRLLLTVGRFVPRKGQDMVLRALPRIVENFPDLIYVMAGAGDAARRDSLNAMIRQFGLQDHAMILDNPDNASVAWLYKSCEVFVMANRTMPNGDTEGFGIVFLEAGAWGKPVIGGRAGGVVDAVDDGITGLLVDGTSADEIADAIQRLLSDKDLARRLGEAGRQKSLRNTWKAKSDEYRCLLDDLAGTSG